MRVEWDVRVVGNLLISATNNLELVNLHLRFFC